jgi:lipopolysaccharide/colanic/teichoic acid biosynthesis glycosyltransferase
MEIGRRGVQLAQVPSRRTSYYVLKGILDKLIALIGLVLFSPIMATIAVLIKLDSPGPAIFTQKRVGKDGRVFRMFKFRTLCDGLDTSKHEAFMRAFVRGEIEGNTTNTTVYKPLIEAQVTKVGRMLRKTSLDELPQLLNILLGDMSLVGPRPNVVWEVEEYKGWHKERLNVLPGITGLAQVSGRSGIGFDAIARYDIEYVRNQNLWLDLKIILKTFTTVFAAKGVE